MKQIDFCQKMFAVGGKTKKDYDMSVGRLCFFLIQLQLRRDIVTYFVHRQCGLDYKDAAFRSGSALRVIKEKFGYLKKPFFSPLPHKEEDKRSLLLKMLETKPMTLKKNQHDLIMIGYILESLFLGPMSFDLTQVEVNAEIKNIDFLVTLGRMFYLSNQLDQLKEKEFSLGHKTLMLLSSGFLSEKPKSIETLKIFGMGCCASKIPLEQSVKIAELRSNLPRTTILEGVFEGYDLKSNLPERDFTKSKK